MKRTRRKSRSKRSNLMEAKRPELLAMAKSFGICGRHKMTKKELIRALEPDKKRSPGPDIPGRPGQPVPVSPEISKREGYYDLPWSYGETELVLMPVSPYLIHAYWDFSPKDWGEIQGKQEQVVLRIYDVTMIQFDGTNAHQFFDIPVTLEAQNWYIPLWSAEKSLCADLGWLLPGGSFRPISRSNVIQTPRAGVSIFEDTRWLEVTQAKGRPVREDLLRNLRLKRTIIPRYESREKRPSFWGPLMVQTTSLTDVETKGLSSGVIRHMNKTRDRT